MTVNSNTGKTKHFDEWASDKSPFLASACLSLASSADDCLEILGKLKSGERIEGYIQLPLTKEWLGLYRNHRKLYKGFVSAFRSLNDECAKLIDFYELIINVFHQIGKMTKEEFKDQIKKVPPEELQKETENVRKAFSEFNQFLMEDDEGGESDEHKIADAEEKKKGRRFLQTPEVMFYFRVWIPCILIYGIYPPHLLMKARHGDEDALEKLLRLDKSVIDNPKIMEIFHQAAVAKQRSKMSLMTQAMQRTPKVKLSLQTIKYNIAGLISIISIALGQKLQTVEINRLFDAIACDTGKGAIDEDLSVSPETFEKAVQRARSFWQVIHRRTNDS